MRRPVRAAIAKNGRKFADLLHKNLGACMEKLLAATATGKGEEKAVAKCDATLDLGSALSKASVARDKALVAIARKCADVTPAALGSPCDPAAPDVATVGSCVLRAHVSDVAKMIAGEFNDVCVTLTSIGLADEYLAVCSGPLMARSRRRADRARASAGYDGLPLDHPAPRRPFERRDRGDRCPRSRARRRRRGGDRGRDLERVPGLVARLDREHADAEAGAAVEVAERAAVPRRRDTGSRTTR